MIPVLLKKFKMHCGDDRMLNKHTIRPLMIAFCALSGLRTISKNSRLYNDNLDEYLLEKQLLIVEEYHCRLLSHMAHEKDLCQLTPFVERSIYSNTTKQIESLEMHGKIFRKTYPFCKIRT